MKTVVRLIVMFWVVVTGAQAPDSAIADSLFNSGNYTQAINYYAQWSTLSSQLKIAQAYTALGNSDKAISQYEYIVGKHSDMLSAYKELGKLYYKTRQFDKAQKVFNFLTKKDSLNPDNYYRLGLAEKALRRLKEAKSEFRRAFILDSTHIININELGTLYLKQRQMDSVHFVVDKGLRMAPKNASLANLKALAYYNYQEYKKAIPYYEQLIEQNQIEVYIFMHLAKCYKTEWMHEEAIACYKNVIALDPDNAAAYSNIGGVFRKDKQLDSALVYYNKALNVKKVDLSQEYTVLASAYRAKQNYKKALDYYKLAYKEAPDNFMVYYNLCFVGDHYYKDPEVRLKYYQEYVNKFGDHKYGKMYKEHAQKRISELKTQIHFTSD